jgi:hypothetical protein
MKTTFASPRFFRGAVLAGVCALVSLARADVGVGAKPLPGAEVLFDGTRALLDEKWTYWQGPRFGSALPIKWKVVDDPVDKGGFALQTDDPAVTKGKYGVADIVTKKAYRDFRLHIEFLVMNPRGNSGVYLQNRYEIQIQDGDATKHGMGAVINETESPYFLYKGLRQWNSYDLVFEAPKFDAAGKLTKPAYATVILNGVVLHNRKELNGPTNHRATDPYKAYSGKGGISLQDHGNPTRFRNIWIRQLGEYN